MDENGYEIQLLKTNPNNLIVHYQPIIKIIVNKYLYKGFFSPSNKDDLTQQINEQLLIKIPKIQAQFNGKVLLKTYFSVIINNICYDMGTKNKVPQFQELNETYSTKTYTSPVETMSRIIIKNEFDRLDKVFKLYYQTQGKLIFCLKAFFKIPIVQDDIEKCFPGFKINGNKVHFDALKAADENMLQKDVIERVTALFNEYERKEITSDSIRKWVTKKISELVTLMNGNPQRANYDQETLKLLLEKYFAKN